MEIMHVAAELAPISKIGGLADVLHGLSKALIAKKHQVKIILPKYDTLNLNEIEHLTIVDSHHVVKFDGALCPNTLWEGEVDGIPVLLIESHHRENFFERGQVYGCEDDTLRFLYFSVAALEYIQKQNIDILHLHDWHTAIIAGLIKNFYPNLALKTILTIHNFAHQGNCRAEELAKVDWIDEQFQENGSYNLLKGGIIYADVVTTVSPSYAKELLTTEISGGLQKTLQKHHSKFLGILNGIDYATWSPQTDRYLPFHYSVHTLEKKEQVKRELKKRLSLADEPSPLVCAVTRLVEQKGPEFIKSAILRTLEWGGQFILLGLALDDKMGLSFHHIKRKLAGTAHVHLELTYSEELSHLVFAASDLFLIPSLFEPCGLTQMISMRYGTLPLARHTGGLKDTVFDLENGFTFEQPTLETFHRAFDHALETWYQKPMKWQAMQKMGMESDFSWNKPADEYLKIYGAPDPLSVNNLIT